MAIHYSVSQGNVACGRTGLNLDMTQDAKQASCKLCLRTLEKEASEPVRKTPTLAELRAAAKAAKQAVAASASATPSATLSPRAEWQQRLTQLPGKHRMPRGLARQVFV
ncbi:hypothetical protein DBR00_10020 [Pseudomonas sp. HMWF032]|uniref:hypothetical protein n=1 Tax=unclassified Pseudomonas TaxID=196821 RepID=UPI000D3BC283|nr:MULTISPECIES: hypothetical protein [unclassified Pseudomonas]PTS84255.1 hypothetical protein DBR00_10020 [Pseudomonas sp. HMWF032]PTT82534.1 hypothetical protein DBR41_13290 [Pseudomonas sp. HMWF010]WAC44244.1 hypothetical protein OU997_18720 [Pseudomonas sp. SL4(2022)]